MKPPNPTINVAPPRRNGLSLAATLKSFPRPVWIIFLGTFINRFGTFVLPFLALHLIRLGYSINQAGAAMAAYGGGHLLASVIGGHLADTIGRRNTIILSMFSSAVSMLLLSQAENLAVFIGLAGLAGLTAELYKPASSAFLTDVISADKRVVAFATYRFAINAGWAIGPATAGLLARYSYLWLFVGDAVTSLAFGLIAMIALPQLRQGNREDWHSVLKAFSNLKNACAAAFRNPRLVQVCAASFFVSIVFMQMPTTFGLEVKSAGYDEWVYGVLLALNGILIILFEIPISNVTQHFQPRAVMAFGFSLIGGGFGFLAFADSAWAFAAGMAVFTFGEMISMPVALAYVSELAPDHMRGRFMGVYSLTWGLALTCGPSLGMFVFSINPVVFWSLCALSGLLGARLIQIDLANRTKAPEECAKIKISPQG